MRHVPLSTAVQTVVRWGLKKAVRWAARWVCLTAVQTVVRSVDRLVEKKAEKKSKASHSAAVTKKGAHTSEHVCRIGTESIANEIHTCEEGWLLGIEEGSVVVEGLSLGADDGWLDGCDAM